MLFREGDLIETFDGVIFDVKGQIHPPDKVIAFPRFIPTLEGPRSKRETKYGKIYSLPDRFKFLLQNAPELIVQDLVLGETGCEVPVERIKEHYKPTQKLQKLMLSKELKDLDAKAFQLAATLRNAARISWSSIGISGSLLVGLQTPTSDIDPIVYGVENCRKVYAVLQKMLEHGNKEFKPYSRAELKVLFDFRSKDTVMNFEDFAKVESRKAFQGKFMGTDYFVRFVKNWSEIREKYGDMHYNNDGYARIKATITDASEALFTPCAYRIGNVKVIEGKASASIQEIVSFRGRFCEQAQKSETIIAQGKVEKVTNIRNGRTSSRLILGGKLSDYMILSGS